MEKQMMYELQDIQNLLTAAIEIIPAVFFTLMAVDLIAGLVKLWDCNLSQTKPILQVESPNELLALATQTATPEPEDKPEFLPSEIQAKTSFMPETPDEIDSQAIALLIEKSKLAKIRTVAQQLGIAIRVNGRYQRLDYLRAQLFALLKSQPHEVTRTFAQLEAEAAV
jgi:hypothetical protein